MALAASKYRARRTWVDGTSFSSGMEARRYIELCTLQRAGLIRDLQIQPRYPITIHGVLVTTYVGDFHYVDVATNAPILEDVKGYATEVYKLKKKLVKALYNIDILETQA